jgi:ABC-type transport system involved in multi-copper enzyme maturation permease subunit
MLSGFKNALPAIALSTFRQLIRDPAVLLAGLGALGLIVGAPVYAVFHVDDPGKVMADMGLSSALLGGLIIALLGPARAVAYELEDRTALTLLSKPVSIPVLVLGKYIGVLAAIGIVMLPLSIAVLYVVGISDAGLDPGQEYAKDVMLPSVKWMLWSLLATGILAGGAGFIKSKNRLGIGFGILMLGSIVGLVLGGCFSAQAVGRVAAQRFIATAVAGLMSMMVVGVVASVALAAAVRFGAMGTVGAGLGATIAGFARGLPGDSFSDIVLRLVPGLEILNVMEAAAAGQGVGGSYVAWSALYATMYIVAALLVGTALMHGREIG